MAVRFVAALQTATLREYMTDSDGNILPRGTVVVVLPQTVAGAVAFSNGKTLKEGWLALENALAGYQTNLIRLAKRVTNLEGAI